ncbi:hypothetical protein ABPG72_021919 [Tetrahymena utriculariae]
MLIYFVLVRFTSQLLCKSYIIKGSYGFASLYKKQFIIEFKSDWITPLQQVQSFIFPLLLESCCQLCLIKLFNKAMKRVAYCYRDNETFIPIMEDQRSKEEQKVENIKAWQMNTSKIWEEIFRGVIAFQRTTILIILSINFVKVGLKKITLYRGRGWILVIFGQERWMDIWDQKDIK